MKKFIMTIIGSPRKDGFSAEMLKCFTEFIGQSSVEHCLSLKNYNAFDCGFAPCNDCRACREIEGCVNHDMDEFYHDFETADAIVIVTPVYNMTFPAPLKAITDRMQRYYNARFSLNKRPPIAKHRPVILLAAAGDPSENGDVIVRQLKRIFTVTNCELVGTMVCRGTDKMSVKTFLNNSLRDNIQYLANQCLENF